MQKSPVLRHDTPHLIYAVELYGSATDTNLHKLQILQNKFLRILQMRKLKFPTNSLYKAYDTFKIRDLYEQNLLLLTHKIIHHPDHLPKIYQNYLTLHSKIHGHENRHGLNIYPHHIRTNWGAKDFRFKSHSLWNALPVQIKITDNTNQFKSLLRNYYFMNYL